MQIAYNEAKKASELGEVPVGAVIVKDGQIVSVAKNNREETGDATGHAEIVAIRNACESLGGWHLSECTLYVTLEPCPMCMGAIINSRIKRVVFAAKDAKAGACGSVIDLSAYPLNHKPTVDSGFMKDECAALLNEFFRTKRNK
jgi:tRNA(adenine34) deaminase